MSNTEIKSWQKRFYAQPKVYEVWVGGEGTGDLYDSREAAQVHVDWLMARRNRRGSIQEYPLHSLELAKERWR